MEPGGPPVDPREGSRGVSLGGIPPDRPRGFVRVMGYGSFVIGHRLRVRDYRLRVTGYRSRVTDYRLRVTGCELPPGTTQLRVLLLPPPRTPNACRAPSSYSGCATLQRHVFCLIFSICVLTSLCHSPGGDASETMSIKRNSPATSCVGELTCIHCSADRIFITYSFNCLPYPRSFLTQIQKVGTMTLAHFPHIHEIFS